MKLVLVSTTLCMLSACAVMQSTPWDWLDDSEGIRWIDVTVEGHGYQVSYSVPDHPEGRGQHILAWPEYDKAVAYVKFQSPPENSEGYTPWVRYYWDSWWGGFFKQSGYDFRFSISLNRCNGKCSFLGYAPQDWIKWRNEEYLSFYSNPQMIENMGEEFFSRFRIESYSNALSHSFVFENSPMTLADSVSYNVPINDKHYLSFSFFVSKLRFGLREEPEWNQRRWQLVREIMDTVTITPDPWGELAN